MPRRQQKFWQRNDGLLVNKEREKKEYKRKGNRGEHRSTLSVLSVLAGAQILKVKMYLQVRCIINNQRVTDFLVWIRNDLLPSKQMWEASPAERTLVCRERWCSLVAVHHAWRRARSPALGSGSHAGRNTQVVLPGCCCWHSRGPAPFLFRKSLTLDFVNLESVLPRVSLGLSSDFCDTWVFTRPCRNAFLGQQTSCTLEFILTPSQGFLTVSLELTWLRALEYKSLSTACTE